MVDTLETVLNNLEATLVDQISVLDASLTPLRRELENVRKAKAALYSEARLPIEPPRSFAVSVSQDLRSSSLFSGWTMKALVLKALQEQYPDGATANEMLVLFNTTWGRPDIVRSSLSPQLSRLKDEGKIERAGFVWKSCRAANAAVRDDEAPANFSAGASLFGDG